MKKMLVSLMLTGAMVLSVGSLVGCGKGFDTSENTLIIEVFEGGYGTTWATRLGELFEEKNPGKSVVVVPNPALTNATVESQIKAGPQYTYTDLYFGTILNFSQWIAAGDEMYPGYDLALEDLGDVVDDIDLASEFESFFTDAVHQTQYALPWASGANGIVYHADVFRDKGWEVPKTTDQLIALCETIKADPEEWVPNTWPGGIGYWMYCTFPWWAQYEGLDNYHKFFTAKDDQGNYSDVQFQQVGRLESMKVLEALVDYESDNSFEGSLSFNHTESQLKFFDKEVNKIAMIPNGDWLENEMKSQNIPTDYEIAMMKTPIISSIVDNLEEVKTEEDLIKVISYIDGDEGATLPDGITEEHPDYLRIKEARSITYSGGFTHNAVIPAYANAKDLAKDFLRLMYSEEGQQIYFEETGGFLPTQSDLASDPDNVASMTPFQKSVNSITADMTGITWVYYNDPIFYKAGLMAYNRTIYAESVLGAIGQDKQTAAEYIKNEYDYVHERFEDYKISAGILS